MDAVPWPEFAAANPELAAHVAKRLWDAPGFFATIRKDGWPRVHPVGPVTLRGDRLVLTMYPASPKAHDLRRTGGRFALHGPAEDTTGGAGEVLITGVAVEAEPTDADRERGYIIFEMLVGEVLATRYEGPSHEPVRTRWTAKQEDK